MSDLKNEALREAVRDHYAQIARNRGCGCGPRETAACCGSASPQDAAAASLTVGYGIEQIRLVPEGANLGLGCGNPQALASLKPGETVVDLGSGGGFDCFLAARAVGPGGQVIGVDMTADMVALARRNAASSVSRNVEFRLGEIEHLPVADGTADVILSNCVINLSPDKAQVFREAFRILKSGGRLAISDMVASGPVPEDLKADLHLHSACISGATPVAELETLMAQAGFTGIRIRPREESRSFVKDWVPGSGIEEFVLSASIEAVKP